MDTTNTGQHYLVWTADCQDPRRSFLDTDKGYTLWRVGTDDPHYWEYPNGAEGGMLKIEHNILEDYDGCYTLDESIYDTLNKLGYHTEE